LEFHQNHRPYLISRIAISFEVPQGWKVTGDFNDGSQQGFDFSLNLSSMVTVAQVMCKSAIMSAFIDQIKYLV
jgi:hypothetical protein